MSNGVDLSNQGRNLAYVTGEYFWMVINDLKTKMLRGTWIFGSGAPTPGLLADGQFYLDISTGDLYYNAGGTVSVIFTFSGGSSAIAMVSIPKVDFTGDSIDTSIYGAQFVLTGKSPDVNFILFTDATLSSRIRYAASPVYYSFAGSTITMANGSEDIFLLVLS